MICEGKIMYFYSMCHMFKMHLEVKGQLRNDTTNNTLTIVTSAHNCLQSLFVVAKYAIYIVSLKCLDDVIFVFF